MERSAPRPWYSSMVLIVLLAVYVVSYMDRQIVTVLAEAIKADLKLTDAQLGLLTGFAFALFYTLVGVPMAWLADRSHRVRIIAFSCLAWSAFTALCGMTATYSQLMLARIGVGIGEAGGTPPAISLIADYFAPRLRAFATSVYMLATPLGVILGSAVGAWAAAEYGWRTAFFIVAAPGVVLAPLLLLAVREPQRGRLDAAPPTGATSFGTALSHYKSATLLVLTVNGAASAFIGFGLLNWTPAFLMRVRGMGLADIGAWFSWSIGLAMAAGILAGGAIASASTRHGLRAFALPPAIATLAAAPCLYLGLTLPHWPLAMIFMVMSSGLLMVYLAPAMALLQNLTPASSRSTVAAIFMFTLNIFGMGCGPLFVGSLSDALAGAHGAASLQMALLALLPMFGLVFLGYLVLARILAGRNFEHRSRQ